MATVPAILGTARLGNFRLGYQPAALAAVRATRVRIFLGGVESRSRVRIASFTIHDALNEEPNTCSFTVDGVAPTVAQAVRVTINSDTPRHLFNGSIQTVELSYEGLPANWAWACQATDDLAQLDRRRPFGTWTNISATTIAQALIATFAPGFTANHIEAGLPAISINLDGTEGFSGALRQITALIGGYYYVEDRDLHLFLTEATDTPSPLDVSHDFLNEPPITKGTDVSQVRTRVYGKGHGTTTLSAVTAGDTIIPIDDAVMFRPSGGQAISETDIVTYTGVALGGAGSVAGPSVAPVTAPTLLGKIGGSITAGTHQWAYLWGTAAGKTLPSPTTALTLATVPTPTVAPTVTQDHNAVLQSEGTHSGASDVHVGNTVAYAYTYAVSKPTTPNVADLTGNTAISPSASTVIQAYTGEWSYMPLIQVPYSADPTVTWINFWHNVNGAGWKLIYTLDSGGFTGRANVPSQAGLTLASSYDNFSYGFSGGEVSPAAANATVTKVTTSLPLGPTGTTYREVHRTAAGGAQLKLVATVADNTTLTFDDTIADGSLGANAPSSDTSGLSVTAGQVNAGSTSLLLAGLSAAISPTGGWMKVGQQVIRYTGITGNTLTGIPATGIGSIINTIKYGEHVDPAPALTGVTGLALALLAGAPANIWVQRDDLVAQAAMAALEGGDGIYEFYLSDERRGIDSLTAVCDAHLELYALPIRTVSYATRDVATKSGKTIVVNLASPPVSETLTIQDVQITEIDVSPGTAPRFTVVASSVRYSLESILRRMTALLES